MSNWTPIKPKFKKECLLLTASKSNLVEWHFNSWWVRKVEDGDGKWFMELCDIHGDEWGELDDLQADLYKEISLPK